MLDLRWRYSVALLATSMGGKILDTYSYKHSNTVHLLFQKLLTWQLLNEHAISDWQETPCAESGGTRDSCAGILQRFCVLANQTLEN